MFPEATKAAKFSLERHNQYWHARKENYLAHFPAPWWAQDLIISPQFRANYECWLPYSEFRRTLACVARAFLPNEEWMPLPLRRNAYLSLPDLWAAMPPEIAGKLEFTEEELLPLFCAMADPPRFGTTAGRYPQQLDYLKQNAKDGMAILDVGCGVGINTLEIASALPTAKVTGITPEHLEVWMATNRCLPHDSKRQRVMDAMTGTACFQFGSAEKFSGSYDAIVCNGLIAGRFFNGDSQYRSFLECCRNSLRPGGILLIADHFHDGFRAAFPQFLSMAEGFGFRKRHTQTCVLEFV